MFRCNIVFTYVDFDGCDRQFKDFDKDFISLSDAVQYIESWLRLALINMDSFYPYDIRTVKLYRFTAKEI